MNTVSSSSIRAMATRIFLRPTISNAISTIILRGATIGTRLIVLFVIAHLALPSEFGKVSYALALIEILKVVADFGIDMLSIREFAILPTISARRSFAAVVAGAKLITSTFTYIAVVGFYVINYGSADQTHIISILGLLVITTLLGNLAVDYFQAQLQVNQLLKPVIATSIIAIILILFAMLIKPNLVLVVSLLPLTEGISALLIQTRLSSNLGWKQIEFSVDKIRLLLMKSLPLAGTTLLVTFYTRLDVFVLSRFFDDSVLGYYGVAFRFSEPFTLIAVAFTLSVYSDLSSALAQGKRDVRTYVKKSVIGTLCYGLLASLMLAIIVPFVIQLALPAYLPAISILRILSVALIFRILSACLTSVIQAYGRFAWITAVAFWNAFAIGMLLFLFVPKMGANGAALALLLGEFINGVVQFYMVRVLITKASSDIPR